MVGILSDNSLDYFTIVYSLLTIATPFALVPSHSTSFELLHILKLARLTKLFVQPKYLTVARRAAKDAGLSEENILLLEGRSEGKKSFDELINDVRARNAPKVGVQPVGKDTLAYLVFSSGTTGLPKGVMTSHGNIISCRLQGIVLFQVSTNHVPLPTYPTKEGVIVLLCFLPLYHAYGLHILCFQGLLVPTTQLVTPGWDLETTMRVVPQYRVTHLAMIPSTIHQLVNHPNFETTDWSSVVGGGSGAAFLPGDLMKRFTKRVPIGRFVQGYGSSETTLGIMAVLPDNAIPGLTMPPNSAGVLLSNIEARIVRDDGMDVGLNEPGELWVRGPNVVLGYYNDEKATREAFLPDGWLRTGDIFRTDQKGLYYFVDRAKDTLKVSGSQVSPTEIEAAFWAHPDKLVVDVTVAGVSGGRTSDEKIPRAWVVLSETGKQRGAAVAVEALKVWTQENLTKYKWLRGGIEVVDEIPKSPTGKVLRRVLQEKYEERVGELKTKL